MANPSSEAVLAILEPLPDPVILVEPRRRVEQAHAAARDALGGDPVGCDLSLGLRDPVLLDAVDAVLAGGESREVDFELAVQPERRFAARFVIQHANLLPIDSDQLAEDLDLADEGVGAAAVVGGAARSALKGGLEHESGAGCQSA